MVGVNTALKLNIIWPSKDVDFCGKKIKDRNPIGGDAENFANEKSGEETKRFIKSHPKLKSKIFKPA